MKENDVLTADIKIERKQRNKNHCTIDHINNSTNKSLYISVYTAIYIVAIYIVAIYISLYSHMLCVNHNGLYDIKMVLNPNPVLNRE